MGLTIKHMLSKVLNMLHRLSQTWFISSHITCHLCLFWNIDSNLESALFSSNWWTFTRVWQQRVQNWWGNERCSVHIKTSADYITSSFTLNQWWSRLTICYCFKLRHFCSNKVTKNVFFFSIFAGPCYDGCLRTN